MKARHGARVLMLKWHARLYLTMFPLPAIQSSWIAVHIALRPPDDSLEALSRKDIKGGRTIGEDLAAVNTSSLFALPSNLSTPF